MSLDTAAITAASARFPKPARSFTYGTAGVRTLGKDLDSTCFRLAIVAALRSKWAKGKVTGLMVTASHNPEQDNGLKAVDPRGEMLASSWEAHCTRIANAASDDELVGVVQDIVAKESIDLSQAAVVVYAYDTRPTCPALVRALEAGLDALGATKRNAGLLTTPQLHYLVRAYNTQGTDEAYGEPTEEGYYEKMAQAFKTLVGDKPAASPLVVDCANGVGAPALQKLQKYIPAASLPFKVLRTAISTPGALNSGCGADYVKTTQSLPAGLDSEVQADSRMCSFDGDADRIVFYYLRGDPREKASFRLLDGDKIAALAADWISELVKTAEVDLKVGSVQTAYANGSSTRYLEQRVPVTCTPTGVKYLHHAAESYDIGVYFEANGHGTVLFSPASIAKLKGAGSGAPEAAAARRQLLALTELINQTVGDALSDMLLVEVVLRVTGRSFAAWDSTYEDLPNRLLKVLVPDRTLFETTDAERRLTRPAGLQAQIEHEAAKYAGGRSFVRPSGTEDCVRVYAECEKADELGALAENIKKLVEDAAKAAAQA